MKYPRRFREVMKKRTIEDLTLKMKILRKSTNDQIVELFFSMCDWAIQVQSSQLAINSKKANK
ncbi:MAG: hypothetical protein ACTSRW_06990 [Candidatus Helarchaeota archaeon]